jgi:putative N6-adenine-specific DNA methylase
MPDPLEIFFAAHPGLEGSLAEEARALGFAGVAAGAGGVSAQGDWPEVWRANLRLRQAGRVLARVAEFRAPHLAQLDKRARRVDWPALLRGDVAVQVTAACRRSRIYHAGAAAQRVARAIADATGASARAGAQDEDADALRVLLRIEDDLATISLDSSGAPLHRRGFKQAVGKAPLRETLAAAFLRQCGYRGAEPVVDPMCGSGTFVLEAAEIALGLAPGRERPFAFQRLAGFDSAAWAAMRAAAEPPPTPAAAPALSALRFHGFDRDAGAVAGAAQNAARAGVAAVCAFAAAPVGALTPPPGTPGLVMVNPPYGARIGDPKALHALYGALGATLRARFAGWRVGLVTGEAGLARATGLPFAPPGPPVPHGPLKIRLWRTGPL